MSFERNLKMDALPEVLITTSKNCDVFDPDNGNLIATYKEAEIAPKTLALIGEDYIIGALSNKPCIKVWTVSKVRKEEVGTFACRGFVTALAVTSCGTYCVAGIKEEVHIWQVSTGELLNVVSRHYQDITCLRFSSDDSHILSGGKDGHVITWNLSRVIAVHIDREDVKPLYVWNHHSAEVSDIFTGSLGTVSRIATTSLDMTCKIYELDSGILLSTICVDVPLTAVVMDTLEYYVFLGAENGCIYKVNTYENQSREIHCNDMEKVKFQVHEQGITALCMSLDGTKILSASNDKMCAIWDIESMTCKMSIPHATSVTNAFLAFKPTALTKDPVLPQFFVRAFKRDFDDSLRNGTVRKFQDSKLRSVPLSLMHEGSSDAFYSPAILRNSARIIKENMGNQNAKLYEDMFQDVIHGESVVELRTVNNQLYSYLINHGLDKMKDMDSD